jgi:hypothetical protein
MDCKTARLLLDSRGPGGSELDAADTEGLNRHLALCAACAQRARAEDQADARLALSMLQVPIPDGLRGRLLTRLEVERSKYYRRLAGQGARFLAAAVIFLAVAWFLFNRFASRTPPLNLQGLLDEVSQQQNARGSEPVDNWFRNQRAIHTIAPTQFDYRWLTYCESAPCQGKRVPMLLFERNGFWARVYILSTKEFDLRGLSFNEPAGSNGYWIELLEGPPERPDIIYAVVFTSDSLAIFLTDGQQATLSVLRAMVFTPSVFLPD